MLRFVKVCDLAQSHIGHGFAEQYARAREGDHRSGAGFIATCSAGHGIPAHLRKVDHTVCVLRAYVTHPSSAPTPVGEEPEVYAAAAGGGRTAAPGQYGIGAGA